MKSIYVVGSINMDVVNTLDHFPLPGQTIEGQHTHYHPGGKGANQAVAAAMACSKVQMVGAVGNDAFKATLLQSLQDKGVGQDFVISKSGQSGLAFITVNSEGENYIVLSSGANKHLSSQDLPAEMWNDAALILLQNEIPWELTRTVIQTADKCGIPVWMNPAPAFAMPSDLFTSIHTLILNETEAEILTAMSISNENDAVQAISQLLIDGIRRVILTMGSKGLLYADQHKRITRVEAYSVLPVDTTAAGDTFIGAFAAAWSNGLSFSEGVNFASAAAALTVTKLGAQDSIPSKAEIEAFMSSNPAPRHIAMSAV
ncbi:ribokinase [Paenibacillus glycanilyticus]|uniref:Ribokinase n=1 Tax=Paenibacillus glycanilyticus TaxID=126569 RepID=A0ABQ6GCJ6_9BACL|nr:ribokinase [Paenibacillus glycanilyticus]GLX66978.1 ribokinase [Paenibacillus glycanilyticus]